MLPILASASLFEPSSRSAIAEQAVWIEALLSGQFVLSLCIIAVALIGVLMLFGRLDWRSAGRVVLGCFVLLGAPAIASVFDWSGGSEPVQLVVIEDGGETVRELPEADYDPYAGASLRRD